MRREDVPRLHVAEGDGVGADAERSPFFADGLRHADDARLCGCVVDLAHAAVQTGHRGDVDNRAVLGVTLRRVGIGEKPGT